MFFRDQGHKQLQEGVKKIYELHEPIFKSVEVNATYSTKMGDKEVTFYNGSILMEYLIFKFNQQKRYLFIRVPFIIAIAVLYGLSDGFIRLYFG